MRSARRLGALCLLLAALWLWGASDNAWTAGMLACAAAYAAVGIGLLLLE